MPQCPAKIHQSSADTRMSCLDEEPFVASTKLANAPDREALTLSSTTTSVQCRYSNCVLPRGIMFCKHKTRIIAFQATAIRSCKTRAVLQNFFDCRSASCSPITKLRSLQYRPLPDAHARPGQSCGEHLTVDSKENPCTPSTTFNQPPLYAPARLRRSVYFFDVQRDIIFTKHLH